MTKEQIANKVNRVCMKASCLMCFEADKYASYADCPVFQLKQLGRARPVTADDVTDEIEERVNSRA